MLYLPFREFHFDFNSISFTRVRVFSPCFALAIYRWPTKQLQSEMKDDEHEAAKESENMKNQRYFSSGRVYITIHSVLDRYRIVLFCSSVSFTNKIFSSHSCSRHIITTALNFFGNFLVLTLHIDNHNNENKIFMRRTMLCHKFHMKIVNHYSIFFRFCMGLSSSVVIIVDCCLCLFLSIPFFGLPFGINFLSVLWSGCVLHCSFSSTLKRHSHG